jgi:uncharacterized membrane protein
VFHRKTQKSDHARGTEEEAMGQDLFQMLANIGVYQGLLGGLRHL